MGLLLTVLATMVIPSGALAVSPGHVAAPAHLLAPSVHLHMARHASVSKAPTPALTVTAGGALAGANPRDQPYVNGATLQDPFLKLTRSIDAAKAAAARAHPSAPASASGAPRPGTPLPALPTIPTGSFSGYVNATHGTGLSGVLVAAFGLAGQICPATTCLGVPTSLTGYYTLTCAPGADYVQASVGWYLTNISFATCVQNVDTFIGTIYLVHDAIGIGIVKSDTPSHQNISGALVSSTSRDGSVSAAPTVTTDIYGKFYVPIPPLPSRVDFSTDWGYFANFTYVNATPWENISLGFVYLEHQVLVQATLYDAVTRAAIPNDPNGGRSITGCAALTNTCGLQGQFTTGPTVTAFAPPGPDYIVVQATGYLQDIHSIGSVPKLNPGQVFHVPTFYLTPLGGVSLTVEITRNHSEPAPRYGVGMYYVTGTSLDAYQMVTLKFNPSTYSFNTTSTTTATLGCATPGPNPVTFGGTPLRMQLTIQPDTTGVCGLSPMWPIPGLLPVWPNETAANLTEDELVNGGHLDLTPGTYIEGNVTIAGLAPGGFHAPSNYAVSVQSQYDQALAQYPYVYSSGNALGTSPWLCGGGAFSIPSPPTSGGWTFCAPAPPDGDVVQVSALGYYNNYTWASSASTCCNLSQEPLPLATANAERFGTVNLSQGGAVYGRVLRNNTTLGVQFGSWKVCSAGSNPFFGCATGGINLDGTFFSGAGAAPPGWDYVSVAAAGYDSDTVWGYVNGSAGNTSVGNITLTPLATVDGQVVNPLGEGLYASTVQVCAISSPNSCKILGAGLTTTDGHFNGTLLGGWLPWTTYRVQATAAGFTSNWVWVNASSGLTTHVPTIVVQPIALNATGASQGLWLDGMLRDNVTGYGVEASGIAACPTDGGICTQVQDGSNAGGYFNQSIAPGLYNLTVNTPGYYPVNVFFNASNRTFYHLGVIPLSPLAWVSGNVSVNPWGNISVRYGAGYRGVPLGPGAVVQACDSAGTFCGLSVDTDTSGSFNASVPYGVLDLVRVTGLYGGGGWSATNGFNQNKTVFNTTGYWTPLPSSATVPLDIFGAVSGMVRDNSTFDPATGATLLPVRWASVSVLTVGHFNGVVSGSAGSGGQYIFFLPPGNPAGNTTVTALLANVYYQVFEKVPGAILPGQTTPANNLSLNRYGWINTYIRDSISGAGAPYLGVSASFNDKLNQTTFQTSGIANGAGFVNLTAPVGRTVVVTAGPGNDYNTTNATLWVNSSSTSFYNSTSPLAVGALQVDPWGWVRSTYLNYSVVPFTTTIRDAVNHLALPLSSVTVATSDTSQAGTSQPTNWGGMFLSDAPIGTKDIFQVRHWAYVGNSTVLNVAKGVVINESVINLTGDGILAGIVVAFPSGLPLSGATVTACPIKSTVCSTATTNATGLFWINAAPGIEYLQIDAQGFVSNTSVVASPCSDCWDWIGAITVAQFAYVGGIVRGLPSGLPVVGATVSVCSPLGSPTGPCGFYVGSSRSGSFLLGAPAGNYIIAVNDTFYNTTYFPISLNAGEQVSVGTIFLNQFGTLVGSVESASSFVPVSNATVLACPDWAGGSCVPPLLSQSNGHFSLRGPPGPYEVAVSAPGFTDAYVPAHVVSGVTTALNPILLYPLGTGVAYPVTGTVVNASDPTQGLSGATVAVKVGATVASSTTTSVTGAFHLNVFWGTYNLTVSSTGWAPVVEMLTVHAPVPELSIGLSPMTYTLQGTARDGLTGQALSGVLISEGTGGFTANLGTTDVNGAYNFALTNGTHYLTASYTPGGGVVYPTVAFSVTINGLSQTHDLNLDPPTTQVYGLVANAASGLPVSGVTVLISGVTVNGVPESYNVTSNVVGEFNVSVWAGKYTAAVSATGFSTFTPQTFTADTSVHALTVRLAPMTAGSGSNTPTGMSGFVLLGAVAGIGAVAVLLSALYVTRARHPARSTKPAQGKRS
ncbi:MAG: carboxypeptidase-like regulatory domain-containing protein [Thermoplasmata archaeon]|nr:carboxypeptidase-like regulatory domain-containing protein [Thermoplasmata archaeon]